MLNKNDLFILCFAGLAGFIFAMVTLLVGYPTEAFETLGGTATVVCGMMFWLIVAKDD